MQVNVTNEINTTTTTTTTATTATTSETSENKNQDSNQKLPTSQPSIEMTKTTTATAAKMAGEDVKSKSRVDDDDEDITATFTIIAPSSRSRPSSLIVTKSTTASETPQEEVSASFVLTQRRESRTPTPTSRTHTPTENVETTIVIAPASPSMAAKDQTQATDESGGREDESKQSKKTEPPPLEQVDSPRTSSTSSPTSNQVPLKIQSPTTQRAQSTERIRAAFFSPLPLITNAPITTSPLPSAAATSSSNDTPTTTTPTLDSPVRLRDKRSLFDIDNASSQTLADKLRHEVNRYGYDEKRGGIFEAGGAGVLPSHESSTDRDSSISPLFGNLGPIAGGAAAGAYNYNSRRSLDSSSSLPNSPLHHIRDRESGGSETSANAGGSTLSGGSNASAAERRPSWRLKFDSGSKVCTYNTRSHICESLHRFIKYCFL